MATTPETRLIRRLVEAADEGQRQAQNGQAGAALHLGQQIEAVYVPQFQRFLVWEKAKRRNLIDSIHRGLPIGSLLIHREFPQEGRAKLTLIDGLQRMTAVREYFKAPLDYNQYRHVPAEIRGAFEDALTVRGLDVMRLDAAMDKWFSQVKTTSPVDGYRPDRLLEYLTGELEAPDALDADGELDGITTQCLEGLKAWIDIGDYEVPVLMYEGDEENLATAFELLNSQGTILSKYDIFAAQWANAKTLIANEAIREEAQVKYRAWEDAGWAVELPENYHETEEHNLYEYLLGLGRHLTSKFPALFSRATEGKLETESLGFVLASIAFGLKPTKSQMPGLPLKMRRHAAVINPGAFETALLHSVEDVDRALRRFLHIRLNSADGDPTYDHAHAELQMASLISSALLLRHDPENDWQERPAWAAERRQLFERTAAHHYVVDILNGTWESAGDTLSFERVWQVDDNGRSTGTPSDYYLRPLSENSAHDALNYWFNQESFPREQLQRGTPRDVDKLLLRLVYCNILHAGEDLDPAQGFDLDHIYAVKRIADAIKAGHERGWPMNCVANLMLLDRKLNRAKREMTVKEAVEAYEDPEEKAAISETVERFLLVPMDEIVVDGQMNAENSLVHPTRHTYEAFLWARWAPLKQGVVATLNLDPPEPPAG